MTSELDDEHAQGKAGRKQMLRNLKMNWNNEYSKIFVNGFNPLTNQFETKPHEQSGAAQFARAADSRKLAEMFESIPNEFLFRDSFVTLEHLRAARKSLQYQQDNIHCFNDTVDSTQNPEKNVGCMQFIKALDIPASSDTNSRQKEVILFHNFNLELQPDNKKFLALPPLCSRGTRNWMHSIVQADHIRNRVAQLIGFQNRLSLMVNTRWFKLVKMWIIVDRSFERQWSVLEKCFDPNEQFTECSKWTARCTLAYLQDHTYALLKELLYLLERVAYKNTFSNSEASKVDLLFKCLEHNTSLLPYPIRQLTKTEENKEVYKLCLEAKRAECSPYRRFISPKWMNTGDLSAYN
jgi:hypothetical protein